MPSTSSSQFAFEPSLHFEKVAASYEETSAAMKDTARQLLSLGPPLTAESVVLDNASGPGIVTGEILRLPQFAAARDDVTLLPRIHATDYMPAMISALKARAQREGWPEDVVKADVMDSMDLSKFPDNIFTHAYMAAAIFFIPNPAKAVAEMKRTLKPGGAALVTSFERQGFVEIFQNAQKVIRPNAPLWEGPLSVEWLTEGKLRSVMEGGGFERGKVEIRRFSSWSHGMDWSKPGTTLLKETFTRSITDGWGDEDRARFEKKLDEDLASEKVKSQRFEMKGFVAIATK